MRRDFLLLKFISFLVMFFVLNTGNIQAETAPGNKEALQMMFGKIQAVDCKSREIRLMERKGEIIAYLAEGIQFENVKGCEGLDVGGSALVRYSVVDQKNMIKSLSYKTRREVPTSNVKGGPSPLAGKANVYMGWADVSECGKGIITVRHMSDANMKETFHITKETVFELDGSNKGCNDIKKDSMISVFSEVKDDKRFAKRIKIMLKKDEK